MDIGSREPSVNQPRGENIPLPYNISKLVLTTQGKGKDRITPENNDDARDPCTNKNGEDEMPQNKNQAVILKTPNDPHTEVWQFEGTDSVTTLTHNYQFAINIGLTAWGMHPINLSSTPAPAVTYSERSLSNPTGSLWYSAAIAYD